MTNRSKHMLIALTSGASAAILALTIPLAGQTPAYRAPRLADAMAFTIDNA